MGTQAGETGADDYDAHMKTLTVTQAKAQLGKLVDQVHGGAPVLLVHKNKLVKMSRMELPTKTKTIKAPLKK